VNLTRQMALDYAVRGVRGLEDAALVTDDGCELLRVSGRELCELSSVRLWIPGNRPTANG
jgi:hypothetical protein